MALLTLRTPSQSRQIASTQHDPGVDNEHLTNSDLPLELLLLETVFLHRWDSTVDATNGFEINPLAI